MPGRYCADFDRTDGNGTAERDDGEPSGKNNVMMLGSKGLFDPFMLTPGCKCLSYIYSQAYPTAGLIQ